MLNDALRKNMMKPGERFCGRKKGQANSLTLSIKEAIENAFEQLGGMSYLVHVGKNDPRTFCALLSKLLPTKIANADGSPILAALTNLSDAELAARTALALERARTAGVLEAPTEPPILEAEAVRVDNGPQSVPQSKEAEHVTLNE